MTKALAGDEILLSQLQEKFSDDDFARKHLAFFRETLGEENKEQYRILLSLGVLHKNYFLSKELLESGSAKVDARIKLKETNPNLFHIVAENGDERMCEILIEYASRCKVLNDLLHQKTLLPETEGVKIEVTPLEIAKKYSQKGVEEVILRKIADEKLKASTVSAARSSAYSSEGSTEALQHPRTSPELANSPGSFRRFLNAFGGLLSPRNR